ncbi:MAG: hypothetical protein JWN66_2078 [Sphingomonas bacterium]|uniref:hypothetical protein n=1 Tax=Sphingomonas bacterium TaxID=1895847 RepID=UPI002628E799|nr:hypothetical protein [Sphingomonas bacterium]MDB5704962.1 hypothetical protein [Sphingomonas bacterium]
MSGFFTLKAVAILALVAVGFIIASAFAGVVGLDKTVLPTMLVLAAIAIALATNTQIIARKRSDNG